MLTPFDAHELKARVNLVALAGQFTKLRRSGRQFIGLCPLHSERKPSFYVHPEKQVFKCFGCGAGGDVFTFVMQAFGGDFYRSLQIVAEFAEGVALASDPRSGSRFGVGEGAKPLRLPKAAVRHSQFSPSSRARTLAELDVVNGRLRAIEARNRADSAALATACEPTRGDSPFTCQKPDNSSEQGNHGNRA